jgi:hypothetical protein
MRARKHLSTRNVERGKAPGFLRTFFANLGPGLVTGAADDDPSSIATYSVVGAGYPDTAGAVVRRFPGQKPESARAQPSGISVL